jgi:hypothetical protein
MHEQDHQLFSEPVMVERPGPGALMLPCCVGGALGGLNMFKSLFLSEAEQIVPDLHGYINELSEPRASASGRR